MKAMVGKIKQEYGNDAKLAAAVFNVSGAFVRKPFLELTEDILDSSYAGSVYVFGPRASLTRLGALRHVEPG